METQITPPQPVSPPRKRRVPGSFWLIVTGFIFAGAFAVWILSAQRDTAFVWLNPADVMNPSRPTALTKIKNQFLRVADPVLRHFSRNKPLVTVEIGILTLTSTAAEGVQLGAPVSTNASGTLAWTVSREQLLAFNQFLKTNSGVTRVSSPRIATTADGAQAEIFVGQSVSFAGQSVSARNPPGTNWIPVGITANLVTKLRGDSFNATVGAICSELAGGPVPGNPNLKTNFAAACRALIPNGGGLIVGGGNATGASGTNYWFTISLTAITPDGVPLKLR